jgi:pyruvate formate lyase activating enzyme
MDNSQTTTEASYYKKHTDSSVDCLLCPHHCQLQIGESGKCKIRTNIGGTLIAEMYGSLSAAHVDPIEKKPLYHFHPGMEILSLGGLGCNFSCDCCQNYHISQSGKKEYPRLLTMSVDDILKQAERTADNIGMAFTYNEPTVWYEFMLDIAKRVKSIRLENAMVSNGYINRKPLMKLIEYMDAFNIDLKCFNSERHKQFTGGELKFVLNTLKTVRDAGRHLEVTHLVVPGINDDPKLFREMVGWIEQELGGDTPMHISRYFPKYQMNGDATSSETLFHFAQIASEKLQYVYLGNISQSDYQNTICPKCESLVILREGYTTSLVGLSKEGKCKSCGETIAIV